MVKTQGRHGEVAAELHTDVPDRFRVGMQLSALLKNNERRDLKLEALWPHKSWLVLKFEGIETIDDAETLKGAELQVPQAERGQLESGWMYLSDLVGCTVFDNGREIGKVVDVEFGAGEAPLLVVEAGQQKREVEQAKKPPYEIPFAEAYLEKVDIKRKEIRMRLPEGLLDVNAPLKKEEKGS